MIADAIYDEVDISSLSFWSQPARCRAEAFSILRRYRPVSFHRPISFGMSGLLGDQARPYWVLSTHALVKYASRDPETFCSGRGILIEDAGFPQELREHVGSFLAMDGHRHNTLRRLITAAFSPRHVARIEAQIAHQARSLVDRLLAKGDCDFVREVAAPLPLWTICEMLGVPESDRERVSDAAALVLSTNDPDFVEAGDSGFMAFITAVQDLAEAAKSLARDRRASPRDDLMTSLVEAEVDGRRLTDEEIGAFMILLAVAGNDTTRNTLSHTMKALSENPDQQALLASDSGGLLGVAVEEFIRWATPVIYFKRTTTRDVMIGSTKIPEGDTVVVLYESANRDETVFTDPWRFDITRQPNEHLGFGGGGPHYCLGAHLARCQLRSAISEILKRAPQIRVGEPQLLASNFIHGVKRLDCQL